MTTADAHITAHQRSIRHRPELEGSEVCGCFYCLRTFPCAKITEWTDAETTALCPSCGIDAVIGDASGYPITPTFLSRMKRHWF